jgi:hypothetical protein
MLMARSGRIVLPINGGPAIATTATDSFGRDAFVHLAEPYRRRIKAHCYRMTGSLHEAEAAVDVAKFLKFDLPLTKLLMDKLTFDIHRDQASVGNFQIAEAQLKSISRLPKPVSWNTLFYPDLLRELAPNKVSYKLPEA